MEKDEDGIPLVCVVQKPIYDIPQAGRRLQRGLFDWMLKEGSSFKQLDDSDNTIFVYNNSYNDEIVTIGVYVDNLIIVHSTEIDDDGNVIDSDSFLAKFLGELRADWEIVDEGPMVDLVGMQCENMGDGSIN